MRTLEWDRNTNALKMIDQRLLPGRLEYYTCRSYMDVIFAIKDMVVRGAPAIGASAAYGMALGAIKSQSKSIENFISEMQLIGQEMVTARPTAVNLTWGVKRMLAILTPPLKTIAEYQTHFLAEADRISDEDIATNNRMAAFGAELIEDGDTIIHHCNTGSLATVDGGTALGVIRLAHQQGKKIHVLVDETRPRLQGARLTAWELQQYGIPFDIISDNMAGYFFRTKQANKVFFGADRVAANGDVANKVGSYMLALAAHANDVPVYSVFPITTADMSLANGDLIPIEERDTREVLDITINGVPVMPEGATARNPAFDVTPHELLTALITDLGIVYPPFNIHLPKLIHKNRSNF
jgi:methylthioribose-1-phosphate isomerase